MLTEHGIDDANESLITIEQPVPPGQKISFEPPFALVLAQHGIQNLSGRREEFVVARFAGIPLAIGDFKHRAQQVRKCLIRTEDPEVALILIQYSYVTQELA